MNCLFSPIHAKGRKMPFKYSEEEKEYAKNLGKRLKDARLKWTETSEDDPTTFRKKSLKDVSKELGSFRSAPQLSRYENGETMPNPFILILLADALRVDLLWLIEGKV